MNLLTDTMFMAAWGAGAFMAWASVYAVSGLWLEALFLLGIALCSAGVYAFRHERKP